MRYTEIRQFLLESNREKLSPVEKELYLYYESRIGDKTFWDCPDVKVAEEIGRSRNSICEGRNALKRRGWVSEKLPFRIELTKLFSVGNATERSRECDSDSRKRDSPVENATEPVGNATAYKDKRHKETNKETKPKTDAELVFEFWQFTCNHPRSKFVPIRQKAVTGRLSEGYSVTDLKNAVLGCSVTPHNQGHNDRGEIFDDIELICRNGKQVERFMNIWNRHLVGPITVADTRPKVEESSPPNVITGRQYAAMAFEDMERDRREAQEQRQQELAGVQ